MDTPTPTDRKMLDIMVRLCHSIAFETSTENDPEDLRKGARDTGEEDMKEKNIDRLFDLTREGLSTKEIASLAESFGLMLVKLETRDIRQSDLFQALKEKNRDLEAARRRLGEQNRALKTSLREKYQPARFVGQCPRMETLKQLALNIARRPINTLILGASGTGKEVFAKMIHFNSPRAENPFVAINCTAIPETLFESEMFGIKKGVATGVVQRKGIFEQAHTGTLFLDELGDMSPANQAKLLRVIEEQKVTPLGGTKPVEIDVKIISATNSDLKAAVDQGKFREDLYYRLNVVEMELPLLKDRGDDILILAEKLLVRNCEDLRRPVLTLSPRARQCLLAYDWPGNVRELNNEMERAAALTLSEKVQPEDLSAKLSRHEGSVTPSDPEDAEKKVFLPPEALNLSVLKNQAVVRALDITGGNKTKAAELLGISREGLRKHLLARSGA